MKLFATADALEKANDLEWLDNASRFLTKYWQDKNSRRMVTAELEEKRVMGEYQTAMITP